MIKKKDFEISTRNLFLKVCISYIKIRKKIKGIIRCQEIRKIGRVSLKMVFGSVSLFNGISKLMLILCQIQSLKVSWVSLPRVLVQT